MGFEWSMKLENKTNDEAMCLIQNFLLNNGHTIAADLSSISILSDNNSNKMPEMYFALDDDNSLYCVGNVSPAETERVIKQVKRLLESKGFRCATDEL